MIATEIICPIDYTMNSGSSDGSMAKSNEAEDMRAEWRDRFAAAERYMEAQYGVMQRIVAYETDPAIPNGLDRVRRTRVAYVSLPPFEMERQVNASPDNLQKAIDYVELTIKIKKNEQLLDDWLRSLDAKAVDPLFRYVESQLRLKADPEHDIFVLGGSSAAALKQDLRVRGYQRVLDHSALLHAAHPPKLDEERLKNMLSELPGIFAVKPQTIWYLDIDRPESARTIIEQLSVQINLLYLNRNNREILGELWTRQFIDNLPATVARGKSLFALRNAFAGYSALVLGAGPSLEPALEWLKGRRERPLVICAFKALNALTVAGVTPDIVVCMDPKQTLRHLGTANLRGVAAFAVEMAANAALVEAIVDCPLLPFLGSDVTVELSRAVDVANLPIVGTGGSAVHVALQLAVLFGCTDIALAGADFGFPENRLYASGAGTGDQFKVAADGKSYARQPLDSHFRAGSLLSVPANDGTSIGASVEMIEFRQWTERFIAGASADSASLRFYNVARQGAIIQGAPWIDIAEFRGKAVDFDLRARIDMATVVTKTNLKSLPERLLARASKLRAFEATCGRVSADIGVYEKVIASAEQLPEVTALLAKQLIAVQEHVEQVRAGGGSASPELLKTLALKAAATANELALQYAKAAKVARSL